MIQEEVPVEWDADKESMVYAHSKGLFVTYQSQVYDWNVDLSFFVAVLFALWTMNALMNGLKMVILRVFYHRELVCENGDTFMFADNQEKRPEKSLFS